MKKIKVLGKELKMEQEDSLHPNNKDTYRFYHTPYYYPVRANSSEEAIDIVTEEISENGIENFMKYN